MAPDAGKGQGRYKGLSKRDARPPVRARTGHASAGAWEKVRDTAPFQPWCSFRIVKGWAETPALTPWLFVLLLSDEQADEG